MCDTFEEMGFSSNLPGTRDICEKSSLQKDFGTYLGQMQVPTGKFFFLMKCHGLQFCLGRVTFAKTLLFRAARDA